MSERTGLAPGEARTGLKVAQAGKVTVRGTVVDLEGKPGPGVAVRIGGSYGEAGDPRNINDPAGRFEVAQALVGVVMIAAEPGVDDPLQARQIVAVVRADGPAASAGLQVGDEILTVDGQDVTGGNSPLHILHILHILLRGIPVGAVLRLGLARGGTLETRARRRL